MAQREDGLTLRGALGVHALPCHCSQRVCMKLGPSRLQTTICLLRLILVCQVEEGRLLYCRMTVDNRPPPEIPVYRVRDVEMRVGELEDPLSSDLYSFRSGQSLLREVRPFAAQLAFKHE